MQSLTSSDIFTIFGIGVILGLIYMYLLWETVIILKKSSHKNCVKFISASLRIFFLIFASLAIAKDNAGKLFIIMCAIILTRSFLLKLFNPVLKQLMTDNEILYASDKAPLEKASVSKAKKTVSKKKRKK